MRMSIRYIAKEIGATISQFYCDKEEILEWLEMDEDAKGSFIQFHNNSDDIQLKELQDWLNENEEYAQKYREYHYGKK